MTNSKKQEHLNTRFNHSSWFTQGISKKLALQYFASTNDFHFNGKRILYTGREGGTYSLNKIEAEYYQELLDTLKTVRTKAEKKRLEYFKDKEPNLDSIKYIDEGVVVTLYDSGFYPTSFVEYLKAECTDYWNQIKAELTPNQLSLTF